LGYQWRRGRRGGRRVGRPPGPVFIAEHPKVTQLVPNPHYSNEHLVLDPAEYEVLRLVDLEKLDQEAAGQRMGVSRGTVWRLLQSAREKIVRSLVEGRILVVQGLSSTGTANPDD